MGGIMNGALPIGRLFGIRISMHWTFLALIVYFAQSITPMMVLLFATLFLTILIHEFGHCFAARYLGGEARDILLSPLGGLAYITGALVHIPIASLCAYSLALSNRQGWASA